MIAVMLVSLFAEMVALPPDTEADTRLVSLLSRVTFLPPMRIPPTVSPHIRMPMRFMSTGIVSVRPHAVLYRDTEGYNADAVPVN